MITEPAPSFKAARPDFPSLTRIGLVSSLWESDTHSGSWTEYKAPDGGAVVHFYIASGGPLTEPFAPLVLEAARPRRSGPCHYVLDADGYGAAFAEKFAELAGPEATVTLVDRSVMERYNEDQRALRRLAIAEHALNDDPPSHLFIYEIGEPGDEEEVSEQFGRTITRVCDMIMHYNGDLDVAEGVKRNWQILAEHDYTPEGQRIAALIAISIAIGAIDALFPSIGINPVVTDRTLGALVAAIDVLDPDDPDED